MTGARGIGMAIAAAILIGALGYLRDPPWVAGMTTGLREWRTDAGGTRYRWAGSHASFFVPSTASAVRIPLRATFDEPGDWPITAVISIDDRPADRVTFTRAPEGSAPWHIVELRLPPPGSRAHRRINIRLDRTRPENHGLMVGDMEFVGSGR